MAEFICGGEKYGANGANFEYLNMPVTFSDLPASVLVEGETLTLKSELHVTLVYIGRIIEKYDVAIPDFIRKVTADFCEFVQANSIDILGYHDEFRLVVSGERKTVVRMCDVSNLGKFFDLLNIKYDLKLEPPPTHVTLYTLQPNVGISIVNSQDLERLSKIIPSPVKLKYLF